MKITTIFILSLIACFNLFAQDRQVRTRTNTTTPNVQMQKAPIGNKPKIEMEKAVVMPGTNGKYTQTWTLKDGTKVTNTFDFGNGIRMTRPMNTGTKAKNTKFQDRNEQLDDSDENWECITKETRVTLDNDDFMTVDNMAQAAHIYPGAIIKFNNYVSGSWKEEQGERNPITISTSMRNVNGDTDVTIENPAVNTIRNGINTLSNRFPTEASLMANGGFQAEAIEVVSQAQANLQIGASGAGFGFAASYLFDFKKNEKKKYFLVDATQALFMIDTEIPSNGFFQDPSRITKDMMFIKSVTYGIRVLASLETDISEHSIANQFNASYNGLAVGAKVDVGTYLNKFSSRTTVKMYIVGGPKHGVYTVTNQADLLTMIQGIFKESTYASAQPIKYTFCNMDGGLILSNSATDYFITRNCSPKVAQEKKPDYLYTVNLWNIRRGDDDDWQLYGQIWAQVYDAQGREIGSVHGNDRLFDIREENHLSEQEGMSGYSPNLEVTFRIPGEMQAGATMTVWYWLNDFDGGSGNDFLSMRGGNKGKYKNGDFHFFRRIPLNDLKPGSNASQKRFVDTFTDSDGDSFTEVSGNVACQQAQ